MKRVFIWSFCFVLGSGVVVKGGDEAGKKAAAPASAGVLVEVELSDGSHMSGTPMAAQFIISTQYSKMEFLWSRLRVIEFSNSKRAARVTLKNGDSVSGTLVAAEIALKTATGSVLLPVAHLRSIRAGTVDGVIVNSLGMKFVPVPGTKVLFDVWDTRLMDYRAYAEANKGVDKSWKKPGFEQTENHPVVCVNWDDATAFCVWLTQKEQKEGLIGRNDEYRLPTDQEWSCAVGIGQQEKAGDPARAKDMKIKGVYPWGKEWPPPKGAGNFADETFGKEHSKWEWIKGYDDGYANTSPVGSFKPNQYGLYDMGGNVWQICEDLYDNEHFPDVHVLRGGSWGVFGKEYLQSSARGDDSASYDNSHRDNNNGFRCVLVLGAGK